MSRGFDAHVAFSFVLLAASGGCDSPSRQSELTVSAPAVVSSGITAASESTSCAAPGTVGAAAGGTSESRLSALWGQQADVRLHVDALTCEGCASQIREVLGKEPGVGAIVTSVPDKRVTVTIDTTRTTPARVMSALAKVGYLGKELP